MPTLTLMPDNLDEATRRFAPQEITVPIFVNSVPKCGTHLLRNILRMFVPVEQQYTAEFIQWPNMQDHLAAFDPTRPRLSWGHLLFSDASAIETAHCRRLILVRDPYDWVLARARFFLSDQFSGNMERLKSGAVRPDDLLNMMIFGIHGKAPMMVEHFTYTAVAWLGEDTLLVRYEDLARHAREPHTAEAAAYFGALFAHCRLAQPDNWIDRVVVGADRRQSATARENLSLPDIPLPETLPPMQRRLVDVAMPGVRSLLGYE
jgi:hypothetical protein